MRERKTERRWIVLSTDGRYTTLGRASDPSEEELARVETALRAQGLSGWLAVMQGNPHSGAAPRLMEVRPLAEPSLPFDKAADACLQAIAVSRASLAR